MTYSNIYNLKHDNKETVLKKDESVSFTINGDSVNTKDIHKLFFTCEDSSAPTMKNESGAELLYMLIDDSLNCEESRLNRFCLDLSCNKPLDFPKRAMKKVLWQPLVYGLYNYDSFAAYNKDWSFGISVKAKKLKLEENGYLKLRLDVWDTNDNIKPNDTTLAPDHIYELDITEGSYDYSCIKKEVCLPKDSTACVIYTLEGKNYSGEIYLEKPFICDSEGRNLLPEFERASIGLTNFAWFGQNLSKREWPHFEISVNGKIIFDDEVFLKVHRFSPVEIPLPENSLTDKENTISIKYKSCYHEVIPLIIDEVKLLEKESKEFNLISCPEEFTKGENVKLLIETELNAQQIKCESTDFSTDEICEFKEEKLLVISLKPLKYKNNLSFTLKGNKTEKNYTIKRCVNKTEDKVISGSGDMIYIDISNKNAVYDYIKWYVANDIGSFVTIRPVYRWGGQRNVNPHVWDTFKLLCKKLGLYYVHISDGRDIPGLDTNPTEEMLKGKMFLGRQLHERDGQLFYWSPFFGHPREIAAPMEEFFDLAARLGRENPKTIEGSYRPFNIEYSEAGYSYKRKQCETADIKEIHDIVASELCDLSKDNFLRHTGPAVVYKYFYQNGFEWTGAETMDGATEILLAFLRGASRSYKKNKYGVHLALQWSSFPHDNEKRYRRYLLSLYVPYLHGVTDINTEEGLWFMEARYAYHNRLSDPCEKHREQLRRFNKFIRTHSRTGEFYTPIAFAHGRMDGWNGFFVHNMWGMTFMKPKDESDSWMHLKTFYPLNALDEHATHKTGHIPPECSEPFGIFSGTPRGNVDAVPVEEGDYSRYKLLIFAGYNYALPKDLDAIEDFVKNGGTLICTWAHFTDTTKKEDIDNYNLNIVTHNITEALAKGKPEFITDSLCGKKIIICKNTCDDCEGYKLSDTNKPLVCHVNYGKGKIVLLNTLYYPGNKTIYPIYEEIIKNESDKLLASEDIKAECAEDVQYTIYKQDDGSYHYYFTAVDWYNDSKEPRKAYITVNKHKYSVEIPFGTIIKLVTDGTAAIWPENDFAEITSITANAFSCQGYGSESFFVAKDGKVSKYEADFSDDSEKTINII